MTDLQHALAEALEQSGIAVDLRADELWTGDQPVRALLATEPMQDIARLVEAAMAWDDCAADDPVCIDDTRRELHAAVEALR